MASSDNAEEPMIFTNYKPTLYKRFAEMFYRKELTDAILICENQRIHVHKFLLSASSTFFDKMFKTPGANTLQIKNITHADLLVVLEYIYKGEVSLPQNRIAAFLDSAHKLSVPINSNDIETVTLKCGLTQSGLNVDGASVMSKFLFHFIQNINLPNSSFLLVFFSLCLSLCRINRRW